MKRSCSVHFLVVDFLSYYNSFQSKVVYISAIDTSSYFYL